MKMPRPTTWGYSAAEVRRLLDVAAQTEGSQRNLAKKIGVSAAFLNDIILGKREPSGKPLDYLELERVVRYAPFAGTHDAVAFHKPSKVRSEKP